ncbi:MAG: hypothetical protein IPM29_15000 [Planctomycetes bacterium]|nr:hypothetical protein [Planctomycetota bacterium]
MPDYDGDIGWTGPASTGGHSCQSGGSCECGGACEKTPSFEIPGYDEDIEFDAPARESLRVAGTPVEPGECRQEDVIPLPQLFKLVQEPQDPPWGWPPPHILLHPDSGLCACCPVDVRLERTGKMTPWGAPVYEVVFTYAHISYGRPPFDYCGCSLDLKEVTYADNVVPWKFPRILNFFGNGRGMGQFEEPYVAKTDWGTFVRKGEPFYPMRDPAAMKFHRDAVARGAQSSLREYIEYVDASGKYSENCPWKDRRKEMRLPDAPGLDVRPVENTWYLRACPIPRVCPLLGTVGIIVRWEADGSARIVDKGGFWGVKET